MVTSKEPSTGVWRPAVHEELNLVTPCVVKHNADGVVLRRKFRITAADARGRNDS